MRRLFGCIAVLLIVALACAQHEEIDFKSFTSLPSGTITNGIGHTLLKVTTDSEDARRFFEQGLCYYHCFHWTESQRSFRDAVKADPGFAMGWWGLHIVLQNPWNRSEAYKPEREGAIDRAVRMMGRCSPLEQDLIRAWKIWSSGSGSAFADFEKTMLDICDHYPKEVEPRILMAGIYVQSDLSTGYDESGKPDKMMTNARRLAFEALALDPNSAGAHHYWIHACEGSPHPEDALHSADRLGEIAWNSGHLTHMPGHIYYRCGLYDKAVNSFTNARKVDESYNKQVGSSSGNWNYFHNTDFLIAALVEKGQKTEALRLAKETSRNSTSYILWRTGDFKTLQKMIMDKDVKAGAMLTSFTNAMVGFETGKMDELEAAVQDLKSKAKSSGEFDDDQFYRIEAETLWACAKDDGNGVEPLIGQLEKVMAKQYYTEPPRYGRPPAEGMGMALLKTSKLDLAKRCFEIALKDRPNNPYSLFGLAQVAEKKGDAMTAAKLYRQVVDLLKDADKDLPLYIDAQGKAGKNSALMEKCLRVVCKHSGPKDSGAVA